jgi:hypothetical protein
VGSCEEDAFEFRLDCLAALGLRSSHRAVSEERFRRSGRVSLALLDYLIFGDGPVLVKGLSAVLGAVLGSLRFEPSPELASPAMSVFVAVVAVVAVDDGPLPLPGSKVFPLLTMVLLPVGSFLGCFRGFQARSKSSLSDSGVAGVTYDMDW